jgi:hypothetical protein
MNQEVLTPMVSNKSIGNDNGNLEEGEPTNYIPTYLVP